MIRMGQGYDVHRLEKGRKLILGGVEIPYEKGLSGHSDADVVLHAVCDALLGAAALGDIGKRFPDTDEKYRNISSVILLKEVKKLLDTMECTINNIDVTVIAQEPKISPYIYQMRRNIASVLDIGEGAVSIKATTEEGLGFTGRKEGIAALAAAVIDE